MLVVVGHIVHSFLLYRPALSILDHVYRFVFEHGSDVGKFDDFVLGELHCCASILPMLVCHLGNDVHPVGYCSDSSLYGYAVHSTPLSASEGQTLVQVRERWRFKVEANGVEVQVGAQVAGLSDGLGAFDRYNDQCNIETGRPTGAGERRAPTVGAAVCADIAARDGRTLVGA